MRVFEIFQSIQGETTRAGLAMHFVRLAGCDLECAYCDTAAARDPTAGREMSVAEVLAAVSEAGDRRLETGGKAGQSPSRASSLQPPACSLWTAITGGEPLLQVAEVNALIAALLEAKGSGPLRLKGPDPFRGRKVLVETSGAHAIDALDPRAVRIVDVKTPGSGMVERMAWRNLDLVRPEDEVKFVLTGREDYEWAKGVVERHSLSGRTTVLFSPAVRAGGSRQAEPSLPAAELARWILDDGLAVRLNLQIHKYLHLP